MVEKEINMIDKALSMKIDDVPYFAENAKILKDIIKMNQGLVLIGGPEGSGKSTAVHTLIDELKSKGKNVMKIVPFKHGPIDMSNLPKEETVVLTINEVKSPLSALYAIRAASEHLVIATINSKDNIESISKMLDWGFSLDDIHKSTAALINQRLIETNRGEKAFMEITKGNDLTTVINQISEGCIYNIPYKSIEEEFLEWRKEEIGRDINPEIDTIDDTAWIEVIDFTSEQHEMENDLNKKDVLEID